MRHIMQNGRNGAAAHHQHESGECDKLAERKGKRLDELCAAERTASVLRQSGLTADEFLHVIRTGEDPDNPGQVLYVMPWPVYQTMSDHDVLAIYEYLTAIPAINANTCGEPSEP